MSISFELPVSIEDQLRRELGDLDKVAKEALLVEAIRADKLTLGQFAQLLGMSQYEADGLLKSKGVLLDLPDDEYQAELDAARRLLNP